LALDIPGREPLDLRHLVLDVNGTLTDRGMLIAGVVERLAELGTHVEIHLISADTFGGLDALAGELGVRFEHVRDGGEKVRYVQRLGTVECAAVGNGANDAAMLGVVALGIAVIGAEGASSAAVLAADIVCGSVLEALDLLLDERALVATLRH
jgi:soluble P-type ATPase